ncbi:hypothetical protein GUITHDRAFT_117738 [Guillardia theta CCMP2712]|uniref:Uncharacterized protein n=1 Tax=Guillardia theta (strain CCMP2712) TaxID=905079 RepID=L1IJG5_GUITC|nr:hypothetical protein GUITHDRAFT_117738 [Guillardia theta CCMP2712]EKX36069.1 hypothetical protein GUITHDRAFT_117738 [Guillardia theta CCMP2712]|eukprot:XP_005823049.1 hypothetical protein GUITHDRAFT_117738 [Guillardia theta CCMP2712]
MWAGYEALHPGGSEPFFTWEAFLLWDKSLSALKNLRSGRDTIEQAQAKASASEEVKEKVQLDLTRESEADAALVPVLIARMLLLSVMSGSWLSRVVGSLDLLVIHVLMCNAIAFPCMYVGSTRLTVFVSIGLYRVVRNWVLGMSVVVAIEGRAKVKSGMYVSFPVSSRCLWAYPLDEQPDAVGGLRARQ